MLDVNVSMGFDGGAVCFDVAVEEAAEPPTVQRIAADVRATGADLTTEGGCYDALTALGLPWIGRVHGERNCWLVKDLIIVPQGETRMPALHVALAHFLADRFGGVDVEALHLELFGVEYRRDLAPRDINRELEAV